MGDVGLHASHHAAPELLPPGGLFSPVDFLAGSSSLAVLTNAWECMGLPTDDYSLMSAACVTYAWQFAVIIDPHGFAAEFIRCAHPRLRPAMCKKRYCA